MAESNRMGRTGAVTADGEQQTGGRPTPAVIVLLALTVLMTVASGCSLLSSDDQADPPPMGPLDGDVELALAALEDCRQSSDGSSVAVVWLSVDVTEAQIDETEAVLSALPSVQSLRYIDADETYRDFQEYFRDDPEIIDLVKPEQLPTSFELVVDSPDFADTDGPELMELEGVDDVESERSPGACDEQESAVTQACAASGFDLRPKALWIWMATGQNTGDSAALEAVLEDSTIGESYTFRSGEEVLNQIAGYLDADLPEDRVDFGVDSDEQAPLAAFVVTVAATAEPEQIDQLAAEFRAMETFNDVGLAWDSTTDICTVDALLACRAAPQPDSGFEALIWMRPGVSPAQVQAVAVELDSLGDSVEYRYIDAEETYEEFRVYWADDSEVLDLVEPESLPTSFEVFVTPGAIDQTTSTGTPIDLGSRFEPLDGVDSVELMPCSAETDAVTRQCEAVYPVPMLDIRPTIIHNYCDPGRILPIGG